MHNYVSSGLDANCIGKEYNVFLIKAVRAKMTKMQSFLGFGSIFYEILSKIVKKLRLVAPNVFSKFGKTRQIFIIL